MIPEIDDDADTDVAAGTRRADPLEERIRFDQRRSPISRLAFREDREIDTERFTLVRGSIPVASQFEADPRCGPRAFLRTLLEFETVVSNLVEKSRRDYRQLIAPGQSRRVASRRRAWPRDEEALEPNRVRPGPTFHDPSESPASRESDLSARLPLRSIPKIFLTPFLLPNRVQLAKMNFRFVLSFISF
ncbi:hypothetical protein KM043_011061 [Ampulex compressa]|nr:hypothetical protein KM043_011061 [Ampulex compressa]